MKTLHPLRTFLALMPLVFAAPSVTVSLYAQAPKLTDDRLAITLFASDPEIVTPIGMAIDDQDRIFVVESHTHSPPDDYQGPDGDRVKILIDHDNDGQIDEKSIFAEGIHQAMNLAFSPDGDLYVVCAREVLRLVDEDHDGRCERKVQVLKLVTDQRYAHNSLLGITFDRDGWMYIGRGNTGSDAYRFQGQDESFVEGYGDGGNVIRCRPDGTEIREFATGFWNPFDLKFDRNGRLLLVDNDPDARGPNRLLSVLRGGDYGYKSMFGGSGTHPFQGWDGSLPGTLPYIAGTGEAPSGLIDCRRTALPTEYDHSVLATIWNENSIERFELDEATGKLTNKSVFLTGDQNFRPVAIDSDSHGNLFLTDWVLVDYPNHRRGRIWRISVKAEADRMPPQHYFAPYERSNLAELYASLGMLDGQSIIDQFSRGDLRDPTLYHAAVMRLSEPGMESARGICFDGDADLRMLGLLASKRARLNDVEQIEKLLSDPDPDIRQAALMWAGQSMELSLVDHLDRALRVQPVTPNLFEMFLAATEIMTPQFVNTFQSVKRPRANKIPRTLDSRVLYAVATNETFPATVRSLAIQRFDRQFGVLQIDLLTTLLANASDHLAMAAIESLSRLDLAPIRSMELMDVARDTKRSASVRTQALAAIAEIKGFDVEALTPLTEDSDDQVAVQAKRTATALRTTQTTSPKPTRSRPESREAWHQELAAGGDPLLGRHVFYSSRVGCSKCHNMNGRGGTLGPGLAGVSSSKSRDQIIDAILAPSAEFAPQYQAWMVLTHDGIIYRGLQLDHKSGGAIQLTLDSGQERFFKADEIDAYRALPTSLMPTGLEKQMDVSEFRDLIAYLISLKH